MLRFGPALFVFFILSVLLPTAAPARHQFEVGLSLSSQPDSFYKTASGWVLEGEVIGCTGLEKALLKELSFYVEGKRVAKFHDVQLVNSRAPFKLLLKEEVVGVLPFQLYADGLFQNATSIAQQYTPAAGTFGCDIRTVAPPLAELLRVRVTDSEFGPRLALVGHLPWLRELRGEDDRDESLGPAGLVEHRLGLDRGLNRVYISANQDSPGARLELELELTPVMLKAPATFDLAKETTCSFKLKGKGAQITLHDLDRNLLVAELPGQNTEEETPVTWDGKPTRPYKWVDELGRVRAGKYEVRVGWKAPLWKSSENHPHIAVGSVYGRVPLEVHNPSALPRPKADKPPASLSPTLRLASVGLPLVQFNQFAFQEEKRRKEIEASQAARQAEFEEYHTSHFWLPTWMTLLVLGLAVLLIVKLLFAPAKLPAGQSAEEGQPRSKEGGEDQ